HPSRTGTAGDARRHELPFRRRRNRDGPRARDRRRRRQGRVPRRRRRCRPAVPASAADRRDGDPRRPPCSSAAAPACSKTSTAELRRRLTDPGLTIVDVRPLPAYNGWRPNGEARGGHIPGAVAFPSAWLMSVDDAEVVRLLHSKNIVPGREVVLYGGSDDVAA